MSNLMIRMLAVVVLGVGISAWPAGAADVAKAAAEAPDKSSGFEVLVGTWVRPDGGYAITVKGIAPDGTLNAAYANPNPLPFAQAKAAMNDNTVTVFLELRAGGYDGSTYNLTYEAATDVLRGVYYQAVAKQQYAVYFQRAR
jgi:hypothetical protein